MDPLGAGSRKRGEGHRVDLDRVESTERRARGTEPGPVDRQYGGGVRRRDFRNVFPGPDPVEERAHPHFPARECEPIEAGRMCADGTVPAVSVPQAPGISDDPWSALDVAFHPQQTYRSPDDWLGSLRAGQAVPRGEASVGRPKLITSCEGPRSTPRRRFRPRRRRGCPGWRR